MQTLSIAASFESCSFDSLKEPSRKQEDLTRLFNTVLVTSQTDIPSGSSQGEDLSYELKQLTESPAFQALLNSVSQVALTADISEQEAAESVVYCFRKLDILWREYLLKEGLDRLRKSPFQSHSR
jgi:hypothetical protein